MKILIQNQQRHTHLDLKRLKRAAIRILSELGLPDAELSILLVNDKKIQELNQKYLHRDKPTNVLAFPMRKGEFSIIHPDILGDIVISVETAKRQSNKFGLDQIEMIILLLIHGILHLIGYDHEGSKKEARRMAIKQKKLFKLAIEEIVVFDTSPNFS